MRRSYPLFSAHMTFGSKFRDSELLWMVIPLVYELIRMDIPSTVSSLLLMKWRRRKNECFAPRPRQDRAKTSVGAKGMK